jgi:hypothetical protein
MAFSRPAQVCNLALASREMVESATLEMATVFAPRLSASRCAAVVSAVSPDWVITTTIGSVSECVER